jgi:hypothetical protein
VQYYISKDELGDLAVVNKGDTITVTGACSGSDGLSQNETLHLLCRSNLPCAS